MTHFFRIALLAATLSPAAFAADSTAVPLGGAVLLTLPGNAAQVVLGNPAIADVTLQSPRRVALFGKSAGGTTLLISDQAGKTILQTSILVTASGADGVTIHYGTGKNWVPGGAVASVACGNGQCAPATVLQKDAAAPSSVAGK
ncbi:MAG TPA: pilus assembly protein N-terminal domain-containing protein [Magnetospirillaceae bacterium]|nr:pilus assembly protein N-terminal domain-containing protein [Magnetospirillaceae bacterium]